ncbi:hypothetical protein KXJ72_10635 [Comamonas aquatica]|nr:hypothetical protein KXJ72_10635 [Comamonas aquatica]
MHDGIRQRFPNFLIAASVGEIKASALKEQVPVLAIATAVGAGFHHCQRGTKRQPNAGKDKDALLGGSLLSPLGRHHQHGAGEQKNRPAHHQQQRLEYHFSQTSGAVTAHDKGLAHKKAEQKKMQQDFAKRREESVYPVHKVCAAKVGPD